METNKEYWEKIYSNKESSQVSWFKENPATSIKLITEYATGKEVEIIDIGGGDSFVSQTLLKKGFQNISVLDLSGTALKKAAKRLGIKAAKISWNECNILEFVSDRHYDIWHDWAVFHFLTTEADMKKYYTVASKHIQPGGYLLLATFSLSGPLKCSGLEITRHSKDSIQELFGENFEIIKSFEEVHKTPFNTDQHFIWNILKRNS